MVSTLAAEDQGGCPRLLAWGLLPIASDPGTGVRDKNATLVFTSAVTLQLVYMYKILQRAAQVRLVAPPL